MSIFCALPSAIRISLHCGFVGETLAIPPTGADPERLLHSQAEIPSEAISVDTIPEAIMSWTTILESCAIATVVWVILQLVHKIQLHRRVPPGARLPPMPRASSAWGHVELLRHDFHRKAALDWSKKLGAVIRLKLNFYTVVVLNDYESIKKFLNTKELLNRSHCFVAIRDYYEGVGTLNGDAWTSNRKFCLSKLRDVGFAKTAMEDQMMQEFYHLAEEVGKTRSEPLNVPMLLLQCAFNNVSSFFFGSLPRDHPARLELLQVMLQLSAGLNTGLLFHFCPPWLRRMLSYVPYTRMYRVEAALARLEEFSRKQVNAYNVSNDDDTSGFIQGYMKKIEETKNDPKSLFTYRYLIGNIDAFLNGGTFSTATTMNMHLVNFANNPDTIQAQVQQEIDDIIGRERQPTWEDRKKMPFTLACIWEMDRWKTASILGIPRECSDDVVIDGFFIPKGTVVLPNIWAVHQDPTLWKEPQKFVPGRFLNDDGSIMSHKPEFLIPFSTGRRACPGETFSSMEIFLMITYLLQKYHVLPEEPINFDLDSYDVFAYHVQQIKLRFVHR
ncbi:cytochrome P450 2F3-like [Haemaphysalis longicornis]